METNGCFYNIPYSHINPRLIFRIAFNMDKFVHFLSLKRLRNSTYFEAVQDVASSLAHWTKDVEHRTVCDISGLTLGVGRMLQERTEEKTHQWRRVRNTHAHTHLHDIETRMPS